MTLQQETRTVGSRGPSRRFLAAVIGLPILLVGASVAWWLERAAAEPVIPQRARQIRQRLEAERG